MLDGAKRFKDWIGSDTWVSTWNVANYKSEDHWAVKGGKGVVNVFAGLFRAIGDIVFFAPEIIVYNKISMVATTIPTTSAVSSIAKSISADELGEKFVNIGKTIRIAELKKGDKIPIEGWMYEITQVKETVSNPLPQSDYYSMEESRKLFGGTVTTFRAYLKSGTTHTFIVKKLDPIDKPEVVASSELGGFDNPTSLGDLTEGKNVKFEGIEYKITKKSDPVDASPNSPINFGDLVKSETSPTLYTYTYYSGGKKYEFTFEQIQPSPSKSQIVVGEFEVAKHYDDTISALNASKIRSFTEFTTIVFENQQYRITEISKTLMTDQKKIIGIFEYDKYKISAPDEKGQMKQYTFYLELIPNQTLVNSLKTGSKVTLPVRGLRTPKEICEYSVSETKPEKDTNRMDGLDWEGNNFIIYFGGKKHTYIVDVVKKDYDVSTASQGPQVFMAVLDSDEWRIPSLKSDKAKALKEEDAIYFHDDVYKIKSKNEKYDEPLEEGIFIINDQASTVTYKIGTEVYSWVVEKSKFGD